MDRWKNRVALVTGASFGIGASICRHLVKYGMTVVGCARNVQKIQEIAEEQEVKSYPGTLVAVKCDLRNESEILSMFTEIRNQFGRLDVCINNAGLSNDAPLLTGSTSDWKNILDVNILALCICTRESVKLMQENEIEDGQIIHVSSLLAHELPPDVDYAYGLHFYCGTKFMVKALTEGLRRELKSLGSKIRIASISPGLTETEFFVNHLRNNETISADDLYKSIGSLKSTDIADAIVFILERPQHVEISDFVIRP